MAKLSNILTPGIARNFKSFGVSSSFVLFCFSIPPHADSFLSFISSLPLSFQRPSHPSTLPGIIIWLQLPLIKPEKGRKLRMKKSSFLKWLIGRKPGEQTVGWLASDSQEVSWLEISSHLPPLVCYRQTTEVSLAAHRGSLGKKLGFRWTVGHLLVANTELKWTFLGFTESLT